ncbi:Bgt-5103 [Blumeria graminis f. sp. tritici]|uniref:Bgt-5103 n=1 Tax=Blumeria graminis f. sp. tritici TaxID=62690 RepID=A0A9X9MIH7_BLUGR|nr:Bgt-5103 [Blumeria graminis f. sp. tritici]
MTQNETNHEPQNNISYCENEDWVNLYSNYDSSQPLPPIVFKNSELTYWQPLLPYDIEQSHDTCRRIVPAYANYDGISSFITPEHQNWPYVLSEPERYQTIVTTAPPVASISKLKVVGSKSRANHSTSSPRKTLTHNDRRRMCQYHEENPTVKQTEIGAKFGVERSTVSKVLRQKEKYLSPEDRSSPPIKYGKGRFPDIERALSNWVRNAQKQGLELTDDAIQEKAEYFAATVGYGENRSKSNSSNWLGKFKQKHGICNNKPMRRRSEADASLNSWYSTEIDQGQVFKSSPGIPPSPHTTMITPALSPSAETEREETIEYSGICHQNSQSKSLVNSATPYAFELENSGWMQTLQTALQPSSDTQQQQTCRISPDPLRRNSNCLPAFNSLLPIKENSVSVSSPVLDTPIDLILSPHPLDSVISLPLNHDGCGGTSKPHSICKPDVVDTQSSRLSVSQTPTQEDAQRALNTLLGFYAHAPNNDLVSHNEYIALTKLAGKMQAHPNRVCPQGEIFRVAEQHGKILTSSSDQF